MKLTNNFSALSMWFINAYNPDNNVNPGNPQLPRGGWACRQTEFIVSAGYKHGLTLVESTMDYRDEKNVPIYIFDNLTIAVITYRYAWRDKSGYHPDTMKVQRKNSYTHLQTVAMLGSKTESGYKPVCPVWLPFAGYQAMLQYGYSYFDIFIERNSFQPGRLTMGEINVNKWAEMKMQEFWLDFKLSDFHLPVGKNGIETDIYPVDIFPQIYATDKTKQQLMMEIAPELKRRLVDAETVKRCEQIGAGLKTDGWHDSWFWL